MSKLTWLFYFAPLLLIWLSYLRRKVKQQKVNLEVLNASIRDGLTEPASLHPIIDTVRCIGCGSCIAVCPEQPHHTVLGLIRGKAELVSPTDCIGHGACKTVCPVDAITLVFGTEKRGVDIPLVNPDFQTNVPGIFIAGELGGMGLIRNAIEQGRQAMDSIAKLDGVGQGGDLLDVVIVGAGPAGFAASLAAVERKLRYLTLEQDTLGGTVAHYPRGKLVMTSPATMPLVGKFQFTETTKEDLLSFWEGVEQRTKVKINYQERLEEIRPNGRGYVIKTNRDTYRTRALLLAIGRRGTPRKLAVPGEDLEKVVYRLVDPQQYRNRKVLVVGGGDSALEAAASIAEEPGTQVTLSYRSEAFSRAKAKNRERVKQAESAGRLKVRFKSQVKEVGADYVDLEHEGKLLRVENDAIIVCAGGVLPTPMLKAVGVQIDTKFGTA